MADEFAIKGETLTQIADPLKSLMGHSTKLTPAEMAAAGNAAVEEADLQAGLISQIQTVLQGKAAGGGSGDADLPAGYRRADFIQFNGNQWIDTGITGNQDTQVAIGFTWENSTQRHLYGCASSDNTAAMTAYMNGSWRFGNKSSTKNISSKNPLLPYSVLINKTTIAATNSVTSISGVDNFETVGTLLLGACRDADGTMPGVGIVGKVFYYYRWQNDELVQKLVPVTDGNGVYRFWDIINKNFYDSTTSTPLGGGNL